LSGNRFGGLLDGDDVPATDDEPVRRPEEVALSTRKSPAASGAKITTADIEAAERDRVATASLRLQQATVGPPSMTAEQVEAAALFSRLDRQPTSEELVSRMDADRRADVARRNAEGADACRAYADRIRAGGHNGWTGGER
jgi:hypothetical protein